jgi:hypothetical protein
LVWFYPRLVALLGQERNKVEDDGNKELRRRRMPQHHVVQLLLMAAGAVAVLTLGWTVMDEHYAGPFNDVQSAENARDLDFKRRRFELECSPDALDDWLQPPNDTRRATRRGAVAKTIPRCPYLFIDLGANVGDSLGKFIDAGVTTSCPKMYPAYSTEKGKLVIRDDDDTSKQHSPPRQNRLTEWVREVLRDTSSQVGNTLHPEQYCYFGLEGNPVFTDRLRQLQVRAMHTKPRPVRSLHFFTETVVTDEDGPTVLYLDTTNGEKNYWGSSLYDTHPDVRASSAVTSAPVYGLSLSTLFQRIAIGSFGNHIMIKMDIGMVTATN